MVFFIWYKSNRWPTNFLRKGKHFLGLHTNRCCSWMHSYTLGSSRARCFLSEGPRWTLMLPCLFCVNIMKRSSCRDKQNERLMIALLEMPCRGSIKKKSSTQLSTARNNTKETRRLPAKEVVTWDRKHLRPNTKHRNRYRLQGCLILKR